MIEPISPQAAVARRPLSRPHFSTFVLLLPVITALVLIVVPGVVSDENDAVWYDHGWPWLYLRREVLSEPTISNAFAVATWAGGDSFSFPLSTPGAELLTALNDREKPAWCWAWAWWSPSESYEWHPIALLGDLGTMCLILAVPGVLLEWRRRRHARAWQFSLAESVLFVAMVAGVLAWWQANVRQSRLEATVSETLGPENVSAVTTYCGPEWLRHLIGVRAEGPFERVTSIHIRRWKFAEPPSELSAFTKLKSVSIGGILNAPSLAAWLRKTHSLDEVEIGMWALDDEGLRILCDTGSSTEHGAVTSSSMWRRPLR